ncbi:MAG: glycoside hydrolase family 3 C-terminal domain-containing protein [Solobacterium sp.]|nr:glycoside hydrolase family 3 C-terminal domain-containing protein [Solobacterium sp.]
MEKYKDPNVPVEERVEDLLSRMTLEEKAAQLCGDLAASFIKDGKLDKDLLREKFKDGHGRFTQYSLVGLVDPEQIAEITNQVQDYFVNETRLGIPVALQSENLCGYPAKGGTLFPAQINLGCTWEPELAEQMSHIIGQESRAVGITSAMSPVIDVSNDPRWGRTYETYGEDPYLISQFGIHYVRGMQAEGVSCIAKHFLGYASTQGGLNTAQARINDRELYEVYATPFEAADKEAGLGGMMANYGEIDGQPVITNKKIARTLLRDTMGFKGMLTSDGAAVLKLYNFYKLSRTYEEAGLLAKLGGCDTEIPVGAAFRHLPEYVRAGKLDEALIDESVRRILKIKFDMGLFENPYADVSRLSGAMNDPEKEKLSREIAGKSLVLLKNDGTLPLKKGTKLAVIGPHADSLRYPVSGYTYPAYIEMLSAGASGGQTTFGGIADEQKKLEAENKKKENLPKGPFATMYDMFSAEDKAKLNDMNQVLRGMGAKSLREVLCERTEVVYAEGCRITDPSKDGFAEAVKAAEEADAVVMALGGNCGWVNVTGGEGKDRQYLDLPGVQQELLEAVAAVGKPVIVVLYGPGVFAVNWADEHCAAIIEAFMPGQHAASAVTDVLFGDINPSGKLTMSVPRSAGQVPIFYNHRAGSGYQSGADAATASAIFSGGYVDGKSDPLYKFGHGLSYTSFEISGLETPDEVPTDGTVSVCCVVKNTGDRTGAETVQLYTHFFGAHVTRPVMSLAGFRKVELAPGESKKIRFDLKLSQLGYYNEDMEFVVEPGDLTVMVGDASDRIAEKKTVILTGEKVNVFGKRSYICETEVL